MKKFAKTSLIFSSILIGLLSLLMLITAANSVFAQSPTVELTKRVNNTVPQPGEVVTYTIMVYNPTITHITNAVLSDTLPMGLAQARPPSLNPPGGTIGALPLLVTNLTVTPGVTITVTLPVTVSSSLSQGAVVKNVVSLTAAGYITTPLTAESFIYVGGMSVYLPIMFKPFSGWLTQTSGTANTLYSISCPPNEGQNCVIVGDNLTLYTNNSGDTWTKVTTGLSGISLYDVSCPTASRCAAVGKSSSPGGVVLVSNNGGMSWSPSNVPYKMNSIDCYSPDQCVAVGTVSGASFTFNGGQTWSSNDILGNTDLYGVDCMDNRTCWMVGDGGRVIGTWPNPMGPDGIGVVMPKKDLFISPDRTLRGISCLDQNTCVAVGTIGAIAKTIDRGQTWTKPTSTVVVNLNDVSCPSAENCYAVGDSGTLLVSHNGGATWAKEVAPTTQNLRGIYCFGPTMCYMVGDNGTVLYRQY